MFVALLEGLQESSVTRIDLCFGQAQREGVEVDVRVFERLIGALPATIEHLVMELPRVVTALGGAGTPLHGTFKTFPKLHRIEIFNSHGLESLPEDFCECFSLQTLDLSGCVGLAEVPAKLFDLKNLLSLNLSGCRSIKSIAARGVSKSALQELILRDCSGLKDLPETLGANFVNLHTLILRGCTNLSKIAPWITELEKNGVAVQRPFHLE